METEHIVTQYKFFKELCRLPYVEQIWLYGSRARGDNRTRSDIDLAIVCPTASQKDWFELLDILENSDTLLHIDCVRFDTLQEGVFKQNILSDKKTLFSK